MEALKPCPFCGNDGSGPIEDALQICHNEPDFVHGTRHTWSVQCDKCTATMGYSDSEEQAIAAWNRRAPSTDPRPAAQPGVGRGEDTLQRVLDLIEDRLCIIWSPGKKADFADLLLSALAAPVSQEPVAHRYRYSDPVSGRPVWRYSNGLWNGQRPSESQPLYASPKPITEGEPSEAEVERPNWPAIYKDVSHAADRDGELVAVTRETLRLARAAIRSAQEKEAYNNFRAAEIEINRTLLAAKSKGGQADG